MAALQNFGEPTLFETLVPAEKLTNRLLQSLAVVFGSVLGLLFDMVKVVAAAIIIPPLWKMFSGKPSEGQK